jgi:hypothetical protein
VSIGALVEAVLVARSSQRPIVRAGTPPGVPVAADPASPGAPALAVEALATSRCVAQERHE